MSHEPEKARHEDAHTAADDPQPDDTLRASSDRASTDAATDAPAPRRKRSKRHLIGIWSLGVMALLLLFVTFAALSVTGRTVTMPAFVTERAEAHLNAKLDGPRVSIGQIVGYVDGKFIPRITARNVAVSDVSGAQVARFNSLRAVLSRDALTEGRLSPDTLQLTGAEFVLRRRVDGSFAVDFGGGEGGLTAGIEALTAIDTAFSTGALGEIKQVDAREINIALEDAKSGRIWQATGANILLKNGAEDIEITLDTELFNGTENLTDVGFSFASDKASHATTISLNVTDMPSQDFALQSPALAFLSVIDAPLSSAMRLELDPEGRLKTYSGTLEVGAGQLVPDTGGAQTEARDLKFEGARGYFNFDPVKDRVNFSELSLRTPELALTGAGHVLLEDYVDGWPESFVGQMEFTEVLLDPEGMFSEPIQFERASLDMKLALAPFALNIGQFTLRRAGLSVRGKGNLAVQQEGWDAALDLQVPSISSAQLMQFWPENLLAKPRAWLVNNITSGTYSDVDFALRLPPGQTDPIYHLDWNYDELAVKFMKDQPPITQARGHGIIEAHRLTLRVDAGRVRAPTGGDVDIAGSMMQLEDLRIIPARMLLDLKTDASVPATMALLAEKPFSILKETPFGPDVATGHANLHGQVGFFLKEKVFFEDINFFLRGTLHDVATRQIMKGHELSARNLSLVVDPSGFTLSGAAQIDSADVQGAWRKDFGPAHRGQSNILGTLTLDQDLLDTFKIALPKGMVAGTGTGELSVALRKGQPPRYEISSNTRGLDLRLSALGWRKGPKTSGRLDISGTAGAQPQVSALSLSGAGLTASGGRVDLTPNGGFERLTLDRFHLGNWIDAPVTIVSQGPGAPVRVELRGGRLDLSRAQFGAGSRGGSSGAIPIDAALDRLQITDTIRLDNFRANLSAGTSVRGKYEGLLNGRAQVAGTLTPGTHGPTVTVKSENAGRVVTAMEVLEEANGGALTLTLDSLPEAKSYAGKINIKNIRAQSAPALAELLSAMSIIGLLDQLAGGDGILFSDVNGDFTLRDGRLSIRNGTAEGPSLGISLEGLYDTAAQTVDFQGVISPVYFLNALGQVVSRRGEGLFGFTYTLRGAAADPVVGTNPLSILTPGALRGIFRRDPAGDNQ